MSGDSLLSILLKSGPILALSLLVGSVAVGIIFMLLPAMGYLPALGGHTVSGQFLTAVLADPRLPSAMFSTVTAGLLATLLSFALALGLVSNLDPAGNGSGAGAWLRPLVVGVLAMPHAALALGLAFLLAPSGWIIRLINSVSEVFPQPPDVPLVQDPHALALTLALVIKETPFLCVAMITALHQVAVQPALRATATMGYHRHVAWIKVILPQLYPLIRFPVLAVLAYGLSVVDMSLILGPNNPGTWPVLLVRAANDPDLARRFVAAAGGLLQLVMVLAALLSWRCGEVLASFCLHRWIIGGQRSWPNPLARSGWYLLLLAGGVALGAAFLSLAVLVIWSLANAWLFPSVWPNAVTLANWGRAAAGLWPSILGSVALAAAAAGLSLLLAVGCLERERRVKSGNARRAERWLFLPLLVPDISFLIGIQVMLLLVGLNGTWIGVLWLHLLFVFPYVFLTLKDPWRQFDPRFEHVAMVLGTSAWGAFWRVKVPLLRRPLAWSAAVGAAVSLSLYLPTVMGGEGRITTVASEAIVLGGGGDRRIAGIYGTVQMILVCGCFAIAALAWRKRRVRS